MNFVSIGDMARMYSLQRHNVSLKSEMTRLTAELTTGQARDVGEAVSGDFTALAGIERSLSRLAAFDMAGAEAGQLAESMQAVAGTLQSVTDGFGSAMLTAASAASPAMIDAAAANAREKFESAVAAINTNTGGRFLFSGRATDTRPLPEASDILAHLQTAIAGEPSVEGVVTKIAAWFDAPAGGGGYLDLAYKGGEALAPMLLAEGETVDLGTTAADPEVRRTLEALALGSLLDDGLFAGDPVARTQIATQAGEKILTSAGSIAALGATIGAAQERIETIQTRNSTETAALELGRSKMLSVDEYETATAIKALETQLETLYTLTSRLSNLSLTDYM